jgi:ketosteroid isomerase-like protein
MWKNREKAGARRGRLENTAAAGCRRLDRRQKTNVYPTAARSTALVIALLLPLYGAEKKKASTTSVAGILMQMERDWSQAGLKKDFKTLDRIMADDWVSIDSLGQATTKAQTLSAMKSSQSSEQSIALGEMKVRVFGTAAIVTGTDVEKGTYKGQDSSGKYAWMDVFVKRNGRWQAVASQTTKLEK